MQEPEDVAVMLRLHEKGWGSKRIARELGAGRNTVRRYPRAGGYVPYGGAGGREKVLTGHEKWLGEQLRQHRGNADVVRQELERIHGVRVSLRTVERAVAGERRELAAEAVATTRYETAPAKQLQRRRRGRGPLRLRGGTGAAPGPQPRAPPHRVSSLQLRSRSAGAALASCAPPTAAAQ